jgi:RHS repeat-associated protein
MNRKLSADLFTDLGTTWSDYDGDETYGDFTVSTANPPVVSNTDAYQPGLWNRIGGTPNYLHNDHLGTLRLTTGSTGSPGASRVLTAFGDHIPGSTTTDRFGYVGAYGYQSTLDGGAEVFPYLHVGARYYDPSSGRSLQRDPIGILGGLNVYAYAENNPMGAVDPSGLLTWKEIKQKIKDIVEAIKEAAKRLVPGGELPGALECAPDATRADLEDAKRRHIYRDHPDDPADPNCPRCKEIDDALHPPKKPNSKPAG